MLLVSALAARADAQAPTVHVAGRIQAQFATVSGDSTASFNPAAVVSSSYEIRRLRIQAEVRFSDNINMVIAPSFEMGALRMRDAYVRVRLWHSPSSGLGLTMGQEKKPFNRYELTSSNNLLSIERGARLRGFSGAAAQNNLLEENGYLAHDLGASLDLTTWRNRFTMKAGVYNGSGESANDVNDAKTLAVRATATVLADGEARPVLRVGAAVMARDRAVTTTATSAVFAPDSSRRTSTIGLDAEWGDFRTGLHIIADLATGKVLRGGADCINGVTPITCSYAVGRNNGNLRPNAPDSAFSTFRSLHVVGAYRIQLPDPSGTRLVKMLEPTLRVDLTDPDTDRNDDAGMLVTPVLNVYFGATTLLRAGLDWYRYRDPTGAGRSARAFRVSWQANF